MDSNKVRFWILAGSSDWTSKDGTVVHDDRCRRLRLGDRAIARPMLEGTEISEDDVKKVLAMPARAVDSFGATAFWDERAKSVLATGDAPRLEDVAASRSGVKAPRSTSFTTESRQRPLGSKRPIARRTVPASPVLWIAR